MTLKYNDDPLRNGITYYHYDVEKYPFAKLVEELFESELTELHTLKKTTSSELHTNDNDDQTFFHDKFYSRLDSGWPEFTEAFDSFVKDIICPVLGVKEIIVQKGPSFRVQLPNNIAVGGNEGDLPEKYGWHRDSDVNYNHPKSERNFLVPLTPAGDTASVWIEHYEGSNTFSPAIMRVGEFFRFNGATCVHGNKPNETGKTRVSFDFRVVLPDEYDPTFENKSKSGKQRFVIGGYYKRVKADD